MKINSCQLSELKFKEFSLVGYSVAGEETVVIAPELHCVFDIGRCPQEALAMNHVLISHGHADHAAGLLYYFSQRAFKKMGDGFVLVPAPLFDPITKLIKIWETIDASVTHFQLIGMNPGEDLAINKKLVIRTFDTNHVVPSLGYAIIEICNKLKEEFIGLSKRELVDLKHNGVQITTVEEIPLIAYLGDTTVSNFSDLPHVAQARVLVLECTFFEDAHLDMARTYKHIHVSDLPFILENMRNHHIVITHMTKRTSFARATEILRNTLRPDIMDKICFLRGRYRDSESNALL